MEKEGTSLRARHSKGRGKGSRARDRAHAMDRREAPPRARASLSRFLSVQNPLLFQTSATQTSNRPFHGFFFTFDVDKLGKSVDTTGKTALILIKSPSFKVIRPRKVAKNVALKFRDFDRGPISLLVFNNSLSD